MTHSDWCPTVRKITAGLAVVLGVVTAATPGHAQQIRFHGAQIGKSCGPVCPNQLATCTLQVMNIDDFGDTVQIDMLCDTVHHTDGDVTACKAGGPFILAPDAVEVFTHSFALAANDGSSVGDTAEAMGTDLGTEQPVDVSFPATADRVDCCVDADCDDGNVCTVDTCNVELHTCSYTPGNSGTVCRSAAGECDQPDVCDGVSDACADTKKPGGTMCTDDGNVCTADVCDGTSDTCTHPAGNQGTVCRSAAGECDVADVCDGTSTGCADAKQSPGTPCTPDTNLCTADVCDGASNTCTHPAGNGGTVCRSAVGECDVAETCTGASTECPGDGKQESGTACTPDANPCTADVCDGTSSICTHPAGNGGAVCRSSTGECDPAELCSGTSTTCPADAKSPAGTPCTDTDGKSCTTAACDEAGTCNQTFTDNCANPGCRITGGGVVDGDTDPSVMADITTASFGGQVGAPCGCIGCFDEFGHIQGNWQHDRKTKKGTLHAKDYNSLVCGCDGVLNGKVCSGDGPAPPQAPANMACFSGVGDWSASNGVKTQQVAFRTEVEDRGEPGTSDKYTMKIWVPTGNETADELAAQVCCTIQTPDVRAPNVTDGGTLLHGNIQIHPELRSSTDAVCPKPNGVCAAQ